MTFTKFLKLALCIDFSTLIDGRASTPYTFNYRSTDGWIIEVNTYRVYIESPNKKESVSIQLEERILMYNTFSSDEPCSRHFWFWDTMSEEEYFQKSLINSAFTLSYEENEMVVGLLMLVFNNIGDGENGIRR